MWGRVWLSEKQAAFLVAAIAAALLAGMEVLSSSGFQPYGEAAIENYIFQEDSAVCAKLGLTDANNSHSADCMAELAIVRQRHARLLVEYSLF